MLPGRASSALAGLAPYQNSSGRTHRPARITAGRAPVRRAAYLAALAAMRHNPWAKALYAKLRSAGKPAKVALIAIARKLIVFINAMLAKRTNWEAPKIPIS